MGTGGTSKNNYQTPEWLFKGYLQPAFNFDMDGASDGTDNLLPFFHTKDTKSADRFHDYCCKKVFINPPFDQLRNREMWIHKAHTIERNALSRAEDISFTQQSPERGRAGCKLICFLIPFAPGTNLWRNWIWPYATIFSFHKRINYVDPETGLVKKGVRFPSCLAVYSREPVNPNLLGDLGVWIKKI